MSNNLRLPRSAFRALRRVFRFYVDGFRSMTIGRTLWAVIIIKLIIIFAILKVFFFPNFLHEKAQRGHEADYVSTQILR